MMFPLVPIAIAGILGGAGYKRYQDRKLIPKVLTPERKAIFDEAFASMREPEKLRMLADVFSAEGCPREADLLRKRANLRSLPAEVKKARADAFRKGMKSADPKAIEELAIAFENEGAIGAARDLRKHAGTLVAP